MRRHVTTHNNSHSKTKTTVLKKRRQANRRKPNWPRRLLIAASLLLTAECVAAVLFSPWFFVRRVEVEINGLQNTQKMAVVNKLRLSPTQNIVLMPTGALQARVAELPTIDSVAVYRTGFGSIRVVVTERTPWASVRSRDGVWQIVDAKFIVFRTSTLPESETLILTDEAFDSWQAIPGLMLPETGLNDAKRCTLWGLKHPEFPLQKIMIASDGKIGFNRVGNINVTLGSGENLDKKLVALERLMHERPDVASGTTVASVNLYAPDAPSLKELK